MISDETSFIHIEKLLAIKNDRTKKDLAGLYQDYWYGMKSGSDKLAHQEYVDYPIKGRFKRFLLAGSEG